MKKKIFLSVICILLVAAAAFSVWQKEHIEMLVNGLTKKPEEIAAKQIENSEQLVDEINKYLDNKLRRPTEDEKKEIESGELQITAFYAGMITDRNSYITTYDEKTGKFSEIPKNGTVQGGKQETGGKTKTSDEIVSKYVSQLYALQGAFTAKLESTVFSAAAYYNDLRDNKKADKASARADTISAFSSKASAMEADCDAKVNEIVAGLKKELEENGYNTAITGTIKNAYENEKSLKMSYYISKYIK